MFCARPTAAMTMPSSAADSTPRIFRITAMVGCTRVLPPTTPTAIGSSMRPWR